ncbi:MAG: YkgJ family cysteine cluster protein [Bacteroidia bacterium]|nr:YkgJ family cysteine cluster protein [Bacteroidia bacterium]
MGDNFSTKAIFDAFLEEKVNINKLVRKLKKRAPKNLDAIFDEVHETVFEKIDCLQCGNCCKTASPMIFDKDIERLSHHFKMKPGQFFEKYLYLDEDDYYVFKQTPCPFLGDDNYCSVYDQRPKACREYPHTNQRKMHTLLTLAEKNAEICPAVQGILKQIENSI